MLGRRGVWRQYRFLLTFTPLILLLCVMEDVGLGLEDWADATRNQSEEVDHHKCIHEIKWNILVPEIVSTVKVYNL